MVNIILTIWYGPIPYSEILYFGIFALSMLTSILNHSEASWICCVWESYSIFCFLSSSSSGTRINLEICIDFKFEFSLNSLLIEQVLAKPFCLWGFFKSWLTLKSVPRGKMWLSSTSGSRILHSLDVSLNALKFSLRINIRVRYIIAGSLTTRCLVTHSFQGRPYSTPRLWLSTLNFRMQPAVKVSQPHHKTSQCYQVPL